MKNFLLICLLAISISQECFAQPSNPELVALLQARRQEKNFLLFHVQKFKEGEKSYVEKFNAAIAEIGAEAADYQAAFNRLVTSYEELAELRKQLRESGQSVVTEAKKVAYNGTVAGILQIQRHEKNYILFRHLVQHEKNGIKGAAYIDEVKALKDKAMAEAQSEAAKTAVNQYWNLFLKLKQAWEKYDAITSNLRETGRALEVKLTAAGGAEEPIIYLLESRRQEKNYMLFYNKKFAPGEKSYVDRFNEAIAKLGDRAGYEYKMYFEALVMSREELKELLEKLRQAGRNLQEKVENVPQSLEAILRARLQEKNYLLFREETESMKNGIKGGKYLDLLYKALDEIDSSNPEIKASTITYNGLVKEYQANLEDFDQIVVDLRKSGRVLEKALK